VGVLVGVFVGVAVKVGVAVGNRTRVVSDTELFVSSSSAIAFAGSTSALLVTVPSDSAST
jgi:hypothetical protein